MAWNVERYRKGL